MRLRKQLLAVSLVSLALPWAGLKYMREMEKTLRHGQVQVLNATSKAIAAVLSASEPLFTQLDQSSQAKYLGRSVVAHSLSAPIILDGYADEWRQYSWLPNEFNRLTATYTGTYLVGLFESTASIFLSVNDPSREFYNPSQPLSQSDFIRLELSERAASFDVYTSAPGSVQVTKNTVSGGKVEHAIEGRWQEVPGGYQIELNIPLSYLASGLRMTCHDGQTESPILQSNSASAEIISQKNDLNSLLSQFIEVGTRLYVLDSAGFVLADVGSLSAERETAYQGLLDKMVRRLLGHDEVPAWREVASIGSFRFDPEVGLHYLKQNSLLMNRNNIINRAVVELGNSPSNMNTSIGDSGTSSESTAREATAGYVVAERNSSAVNTLINGAAGRLLFYTLACSLFAGLFCILYASWLSLRIRRLSRYVDNALDTQGRINTVLPNTKSRDEIGDLSRRYAELLARLHEYTEYLQNLASKLSHELRTPLAVVKSSLENLLLLPSSQPNGEQAKHYAERALSGADRLSGILTAMSAANRIEQSLQSAEREVVDLAMLLGELTNAYGDVYQSHSIAYRNLGASSCWANVAPDLFVQMMDKLVENAVDFTDADGTVSVVIHQLKEQVVVRVINPGKPIVEAMRAQIFDSLVSVREPGDGNSTSHFGLGLYIVRLIARFHNTDVRAYNNLDDGVVVFEVALPVAAAPV